MLITLVAHPPNEYAAWIDRGEVEEANGFTRPEDARRARELFRSLACAGCHTIDGTDRAGKFPGAPDLTHVPSKPSIAGGLLVTGRTRKPHALDRKPAGREAGDR